MRSSSVSCAMADESDASRLDEAPPRYSERPLPLQRYLPGRTPRPRIPETAGAEAAARFEGASPWSGDAFLHGVDLWNHRYFWEAHETWEDPWRAAGREAPLGLFLQGLILLAAAALKREIGAEPAARRLAARGARRLAEAELRPPFDAHAFAREVEAWVAGQRGAPPLLRLAAPGSAPRRR